MKTALWAGIGVIILVAGILVFSGPRSENVVETPNATSMSKYTMSDFSWRVENAPDFEETMPRHIVFLNVKSTSYRAGESMGCIENSAVSLPNEITRTRCWFGGGGNDFSVFKEGDTFVLKQRWIQESGGPEVNAEPEGQWEVVANID